MRKKSTKKTNVTPIRPQPGSVPGSPADIESKRVTAIAAKTREETQALVQELDGASGSDRLSGLSLAALLSEAVGGCENDPLSNVLRAAEIQIETAYEAVQGDVELDYGSLGLLLFELRKKLMVATELLFRERWARRHSPAGHAAEAGGAS